MLKTLGLKFHQYKFCGLSFYSILGINWYTLAPPRAHPSFQLTKLMKFSNKWLEILKPLVEFKIWNECIWNECECMLKMNVFYRNID